MQYNHYRMRWLNKRIVNSNTNQRAGRRERVQHSICILLSILLLAACGRSGNADSTTQGSGIGDLSTNAIIGDASSQSPSTIKSNMYSNAGLIAYAEGYTYFVDQYGMQLDGKETGRPDSCDIYRIVSGGEDAIPELLYSVPAAYYDGLRQMSVVSLIPYKDYLYFIASFYEEETWENNDTFTGTGMYCLDMDRREAHFISDGWSISPIRDGDLLYSPLDGAVLDLKNGESAQMDLPSEIFRDSILDIVNNEVFFLKYDMEKSEFYGICKYNLNTGVETDVAPLFEKVEYPQYIGMVEGDILFLKKYDAETLWFIDITSGKTVTVECDDWKEIQGSGFPFNVVDNTVYYMKEDGIYAMNPYDCMEKLIVGGETDEYWTFGCDPYTFFLFDYDGQYKYNPRALKKDARILHGERMISNEYGLLDFEGWKYYEYPNCVCIENYTGEETVAVAPAEINGKPVVSVGLGFHNKDRSLTSLTIPEGVSRLNLLESSNLKYISIPQSLRVMGHKGYPYVFETAEHTDVDFAGTKAQWQAICERVNKNEAIVIRDQYDVIIHCTDGDWDIDAP